MNRNPWTSARLNYGEQSIKKSRLCLHIVNKFWLCSQTMQWDFVVLIWAQTKGSLSSPGNDLCGLNDDSVSSTGQRKEYNSTEHGSENGCLDCFTFTVVALEFSLLQVKLNNTFNSNILPKCND